MTGDPTTNIERIVVGTDGSAAAMQGVAFAAQLGAQLGAEVMLVHALTLLEHLPGRPLEIGAPLREEIGRLLTTEWNGPLAEEQVAHRCLLEDGPPLLVLPRVARREDASLVVVASHGRGGAANLPLGSTSHGLLQTADVPVVVVPRRPDGIR